MPPLNWKLVYNTKQEVRLWKKLLFTDLTRLKSVFESASNYESTITQKLYLILFVCVQK